MSATFLHLFPAALPIFRRTLLATVFGAFPLAWSAPAPTHRYELDGNFNDALGGPSLTGGGGTLSSASYDFGANQGLSLSNALSGGTDYTILLEFSFANLNGYHKVVDFLNRTSDNGLYTNGNRLFFYYGSYIGSTLLTANTLATCVITRSSTISGQPVTVYLNGMQQFTFSDIVGPTRAIFGSTGNVINFFYDDTVTNNETAPGTVNRILIWDRALTAVEVAAVPESSHCALGVASLLFALVLSRRFSRPRTQSPAAPTPPAASTTIVTRYRPNDLPAQSIKSSLEVQITAACTAKILFNQSFP